MKRIKKEFIFKTTISKLSITKIYICIYSCFIAICISWSLWELILTPGYYSKRAETLYNYPFEQIFILIFLLLILSYPAIVIISLNSILKKISTLEIKLKKDVRK